MSRREEIRKQLELNAVLASQALSEFISDAVETSSTTGVVIGLSGGVDSALATALAVAGLGPDRVYAFMLPYRTSNPDSLADAEAIAIAFDLNASTIDITPMVDAYFQGGG